MNPKSSLPSANAYYDLYRGQTLLVKASGAELQPEKLPHLIDAIKTLTAHGVHVTLVYGGGNQIDRHWDAKHDKPRPKIDGVGHTTPEVLNDAVLPAYTEVRAELQQLLPSFQAIEPEQLHCDVDTGKGLVGIPQSVEGYSPASNTMLGFVGSAEQQKLNVNADDIVKMLLMQHGTQINEAFFLTGTGGILDKDRKVASAVYSDNFREDGTHDWLPIDGGMKKKTKVVTETLPLAGKIAMTTVENLLAEIEDWRGSGTLCVDIDQVESSAIANDAERAIVESVYADFVASGTFRKRTPVELQQLLDDHKIVRIENSPLGGFSLQERDDTWTEMSLLWSAYLGSKSGRVIMDHVRKHHAQEGGRLLYALSTPKSNDTADHEKLITKFDELGFECDGLLRHVQKSTHLPEHLQSYDTDARDAYLFLLRAE